MYTHAHTYTPPHTHSPTLTRTDTLGQCCQKSRQNLAQNTPVLSGLRLSLPTRKLLSLLLLPSRQAETQPAQQRRVRARFCLLSWRHCLRYSFSRSRTVPSLLRTDFVAYQR